MVTLTWSLVAGSKSFYVDGLTLNRFGSFVGLLAHPVPPSHSINGPYCGWPLCSGKVPDLCLSSCRSSASTWTRSTRRPSSTNSRTCSATCSSPSFSTTSPKSSGGLSGFSDNRSMSGNSKTPSSFSLRLLIRSGGKINVGSQLSDFFRSPEKNRRFGSDQLDACTYCLNGLKTKNQRLS